MNPQPQLVHDSGSSVRSETRRIVLFAYHFPPDQAAGALRWQKFASLAADWGWGLDVVTRDPSEIERADLSRLSELPPGIRIFGIRQPEIALERLQRSMLRAYRRLPALGRPQIAPGVARGPAGESSFTRNELRFDVFSRRSWIRAYNVVEITLAHLAWARRAAGIAKQVFDRTRHAATISCGPPHSTHEAGRLLSRATGVPFVMDMRDLWSCLERWVEPHASPVAPWLARTLERRFVTQSSLVVVNTDRARDEMVHVYPSYAQRILTVMNGYDDDEALPERRQDDCFRIAYAGTIYLDRSPANLFRAAARVVRDLRLEPHQLSLEFMGPPAQLDGESIEGLAAASGIEEFVKVFPAGTRREAAGFLSRANVLVNLPQDSHDAIPSKIFEYMRFPAWLLALAEPGSATEQLLRDTDADIVSPVDVDQLSRTLRSRYEEHRRGTVPAPIADERFSRRSQAKRLFDSLEKIISSRKLTDRSS